MVTVLAIDIGTSSARAVLYGADGRAVPGARAHVAYSVETEPQGAATLDADEIVDQVVRCIDEVLKKAGDSDIAAVGLATFWHSMVGVDKDGRAITPLYTWADSRAGDAAESLKQELDTAAVHARTGCAIHPSYFPSRLRWLRESEPKLFRQVAQWLSPGEYLFRQLFGEAKCSISMASATGLFDQNLCDWDGPMLKAVGINRENLGTLADLDSAASGFRPNWASRWPRLARIPWIPAIGDGASGNVGSGCTNHHRIAINLGTSGAIRVLWNADQVTIPTELWCYRLDRARFVMGGAFSDGGDVYAWMRRTLSLPDDAHIERELAAREPDSHGLTFLPFLAGERSIGWRPQARASLHGLNLGTDPLDILHAGMEGVALRFALVANIIRKRFPRAKEVIASGGALAASPTWARMLADALGQDIVLSSEPEATSRGAALVALRALGELKDEGEAPLPRGRTIKHNPVRHKILVEALGRQQLLYEQMG